MSTITDNLSPIQDELKKFDPIEARARAIFPLSTLYDYSHSQMQLPVYDVDDKTASVLDPTDFSLPTKFVSPSDKSILDQPVLTLACAVKFSRLERMAASRCNSWDLRRIIAAKKAIYLQEEKIAFLGAAKSGSGKGIRGILDSKFWGNSGTDGKGKVEEVADESNKKTWKEKSSEAILIDIEKAVTFASKDGAYSHPKVLVVPYEQYLILHRPIGNERYVSLASFLANELGLEIYYSPYVKSSNHNLTHNSITSSSDIFLCFPKTPDVLSLFIVQDIHSSEASYDGLENLQLSVWEKTSGVIPAKPGLLYLGRGI